MNITRQQHARIEQLRSDNPGMKIEVSGFMSGGFISIKIKWDFDPSVSYLQTLTAGGDYSGNGVEIRE